MDYRTIGAGVAFYLGTPLWTCGNFGLHRYKRVRSYIGIDFPGRLRIVGSCLAKNHIPLSRVILNMAMRIIFLEIA